MTMFDRNVELPEGTCFRRSTMGSIPAPWSIWVRWRLSLTFNVHQGFGTTRSFPSRHGESIRHYNWWYIHRIYIISCMMNTLLITIVRIIIYKRLILLILDYKLVTSTKLCSCLSSASKVGLSLRTWRRSRDNVR